MDDEEEFLSEEDFIVKCFLDRNSLWHMAEQLTFHTWPCGIWMDSTARKQITWTDLFCHGMIPRNWKVITKEPM